MDVTKILHLRKTFLVIWNRLLMNWIVSGIELRILFQEDSEENTGLNQNVNTPKFSKYLIFTKYLGNFLISAWPSKHQESRLLLLTRRSAASKDEDQDVGNCGI